MNILVLTQYFWPEEFRINDICEGLVEKGHAVDVLTGLPNYPSGKVFNGYSFFKRGPKKHKGINIRRCFLIGRGQNSAWKLALNYLSFLISSFFHLPALCFKKLDHILVFQVSPITTAIPALILSKIKGIPATIYIQDLWPETFYSIIPIKNTVIRNLFQKICLRIYNGFDHILLVTLKNSDILRITLPAKVQSYMAAGKPILGSISGAGMKTIEESNCGFVSEAEDVEGLAANVMKLYHMTQEERNQLGENGRTYFANHFSRSLLLDTLEQELERQCSKTKSS